MLWVKTLHIFFVIGWFAGLFYLPRLFVNLAMVGAAGPERDRLLLMAAKLLRFTRILSTAAIFFGLWLWLGYGIGQAQGWIHAKVALVVALVLFQLACGRRLAALGSNTDRHSHLWYRWFNEIPTILLLVIVALVVFKPF